MFVLDTDHISVLEGPDVALRQALVARLEPRADALFTTIISVEEQMRGWLAEIHRKNDPRQQVRAYARLVRLLDFFGEWDVLVWDAQCGDRFWNLRRTGLRIGTQDLKIAAITLAHDATLLTRNTADFAQVPGLKFENWLD